jgi:hypothetical protein
MKSDISIDDEWNEYISFQKSGNDGTRKTSSNKKCSDINIRVESNNTHKSVNEHISGNFPETEVTALHGKLLNSVAGAKKFNGEQPDISKIQETVLVSKKQKPFDQVHLTERTVNEPPSSTRETATIVSENLQINNMKVPNIDFTNLLSNVSDTFPKIQIHTEMVDENIPKCDDLYISTKTKVLFLNQEIDIQQIYWKIPVVEYWKPVSGVVKKQMKIVSKNLEEYAEYRAKLDGIYYYTENIIKQIDNPAARRIKFKDERKITIGISKKDIMNCRGKVKNAFYNCFAIILRFEYDGAFREIHVKVFNTGKLEIPGILNTRLFDIVKGMILHMLQPHIDGLVDFVENEKDDNVLINSNFNCGYYINRDKLHQILRSDKYGIEAAYDPCSYPGVKCKFYFNNEIGFREMNDSDGPTDSVSLQDEMFRVQNGKINLLDRSMKMSELIDNKKYTEVSFMIFRTGSGLIVGNCSEKILRYIFTFIRNILSVEYPNISVGNEDVVAKTKKTKLRKKTIMVSQNYYDATIIDKIHRTDHLLNAPSPYAPFRT